MVRPPRPAVLLLLFAFAACTGTLGGGGGGGRRDGTGGADTSGRPVIESFTVNPATLPAGGGKATLSWSVSGADRILVDPMVGQTDATSAEVDVTTTTFFMLSASNDAGTTTKSAVVMVGESSKAPVILSFSAMNPNLPADGGRTTLVWQVLNADTVTIDHDVGMVSGEQVAVDVRATTIYTLTATNGEGTSKATAAVVMGQHTDRAANGQRYAALISPTSGESFYAPTTLRLVAAALDETAGGSDNRGASKVQFFVDDTVVLEVPHENGEFWIYKGFANGIAPGTHRVWARSIHVAPDEVFDSKPAIITVAEPPAYDRVETLEADVVLTKGQTYELAGAPGKRIRLNGNGHRIVSNGTEVAGAFTLKHVDVFDLGDRAVTNKAAVEVTTNGTVTIEDSTFDNSNPIKVTTNDSATASVRRNLFRSNMRMPLSQNPDPTYSDKPSFPVLLFRGSSTGAKVFAGNNVGAGWVHFLTTKNWLIGGDSDEDSNIIIGPRVGIHVQRSSDMQVRRNFSHHSYFGGWSQGNNFELNETSTMVVEHNVIFGSSWPVRGVACEFRYNLVLDAGHQWMWADSSNGYIHHNVFAGGEADGGGIWVSYEPKNVRIFNNTFDAQMSTAFAALIKVQNGALAMMSNIFMRAPKAPGVLIGGGTHTADYNLFFNGTAMNYTDARMPAHDAAGGAKTDPMLSDLPAVIFDLDEANVWKRNVSVRDVLMHYRTRYAPRAGSPVIDAGDPMGGGGNDIGAVGGGEPNAQDRFGLP